MVYYTLPIQKIGCTFAAKTMGKEFPMPKIGKGLSQVDAQESP